MQCTQVHGTDWTYISEIVQIMPNIFEIWLGWFYFIRLHVVYNNLFQIKIFFHGWLSQEASHLYEELKAINKKNFKHGLLSVLSSIFM